MATMYLWDAPSEVQQLVSAIRQWTQLLNTPHMADTAASSQALLYMKA